MILPQPSKVVCVGQNYAAHARELGHELPSEPVLFQKAPSRWAGPFEPLELPPGAEKLAYEVELGESGRRSWGAGCEGASGLGCDCGFCDWCGLASEGFLNS